MLFLRRNAFFVSIMCVCASVRSSTEVIDDMHRVRYYFSYGSDMLRKKMTMNHRNAIYSGPGVLKNYRLDFGMWSDFWNGAVATVCHDPDSLVWGILWDMMDVDPLKLVKEYEGLPTGSYVPRFVSVNTTIDNTEVLAVTFVGKHTPKKLPPWVTLPMNRQPSLTYYRVLVVAALETGLPTEYVKGLYSIPHNGKEAPEHLRRHFGPPICNKQMESMNYNFDIHLEFPKNL